jgi:hypothetical protein
VEPSDILRAPVKRSKSLLRTLWGTATLPVKLVVSWDVEGWRLTCRMGADAMHTAAPALLAVPVLFLQPFTKVLVHACFNPLLRRTGECLHP